MSTLSPAVPSAGGTRRHLGLALLVISCAQLMMVLDATIVNVAIPTIHTSLHFSPANLQWLVTAYSLTFGGLLLFGGRTGDLYGKRRMFMTGIALFAVASLFGGLAQSDIWLIITRGIQGIGAAIAAPTALSLITTTFPEGSPRNRAMGVYAAMSGGGGAVGLLLGGLLTSYISWRWIFFVNVPIALVVLFLAPRALAESAKSRGRLDVPGALSATGGMLSLVYGLSNASIHSWGALSTVAPLVLAGVLLVGFVAIETRTAAPLMPLRIFSDRNRSGSYVMMLCIGIGMFASFFFLTQYLQNLLGWSAIKTGLGFLPMTLGIIVAAGAASQLVGKIGARIPIIVGSAGTVVGFLWLTRLTASSTYLDLFGPLVVLALGMGLVFVPLTLTAVSGVRDADAGLASALLNTMQQVGGALGLAVLATIAIDATTSRAHHLAASTHGHLSHAATAAATIHGYTTAFGVAGGLAFVGFLVAVFVIRTPRSETVPEATERHLELVGAQS